MQNNCLDDRKILLTYIQAYIYVSSVTGFVKIKYLHAQCVVICSSKDKLYWVIVMYFFLFLDIEQFVSERITYRVTFHLCNIIRA